HRFNVIPLDFKDKIAYNDFNFIYVPHGIGYMFMVDLIDNVSLMEVLAASRFKGKLFVEGGTSPIFGKVFHLPNESTIKGLSFFPYEGHYRECSSTCHKVQVENIYPESSEKAFRGYWPSWVLLEHKGFDCTSTWIAKKVGSQTSVEDGWRVGNAVASSLKLEFWSNPEAIAELLN
ncbi:MAG TPA: hydrogenobyrinic acid a,c-diamide synthase, partial [Acetomicrobium sp.]|nr:hydrogenobyrinic acid a,c-diamide synthase [Acetomicrobium sp.]